MPSVRMTLTVIVSPAGISQCCGHISEKSAKRIDKIFGVHCESDSCHEDASMEQPTPGG